MDRINGADFTDIGGGRRGFRDEDLPTGIAGTEVTALFLNMVQEEIISVLDDASLAPDPADWHQLLKAIGRGSQSGKWSFAVAGGTANALTATLSPVPAALTPGMRILLLCAATNTSGVVTIATNGGALIPVSRRNSATLAAGDIKAGLNEFAYDGTQWRLMGAPFGQSVISGQGWIDIPGGLTLQWGTGSMTGGTVTLNWPKSFSASPYSCLALDNGAVLWSTSNASFIGISALNAAGGIFRGITWNGSGMILGSIIFNYFVLGPT